MFFKLAALGALGYLGYRYYRRNAGEHRDAAFAANAAVGGNSPQTGTAGPATTPTGDRNSNAMPEETWDMVDEEGMESFPASDPPANY